MSPSACRKNPTPNMVALRLLPRRILARVRLMAPSFTEKSAGAGLRDSHMSDPEQIEFDFHGPVGDGYATWQADRVRLEAAVADLWCVPLNRRVTLTLKNIDGSFTGTLKLAGLPAALDPRKPILLKLDRMTFFSNEIEVCSVAEAPQT